MPFFFFNTNEVCVEVFRLLESWVHPNNSELEIMPSVHMQVQGGYKQEAAANGRAQYST